MSWDKMAKSKEESGKYIKLKDGDTVEGVFMGEPYCYYSVFKDPNEYTEWKQGRSFKFKVNFITRDGGGNLVAKIFQGSARVRDMLLDVKNEYGLECAYKIKRTGSGQEDTRYSILFKAKISPEVYEKMKAIKLHELKRNLDNDADTSFDTASFEDPFPPAEDFS